MVGSPKRWDRIVEVAASTISNSRAPPDARALAGFLAAQEASSPASAFPICRFPSSNCSAQGEYVVEAPDEAAPGHFGLAVKDYTHSTAPNRRFPDLITQRILKAALDGSPMSYSPNSPTELARHCTQKENDANKVERLVPIRPRPCCSPRGSETGSTPSARVRPTKGHGSGFFSHRSKAGCSTGLKASIRYRLKVQLVRTDVEKGSWFANGFPQSLARPAFLEPRKRAHSPPLAAG